MKLTAYLALVCLCWQACSPSLPEEVKQAYDRLPSRIDFNRHIKPILSDRCFACHGPDKNKLKAGLRLDLAASAYADLPENPGRRAIIPGNAGKSELVRRILSTDPEYRMPEPESHLTLTDQEKALLVKWVEQGAEYKPHWAFLKPVMPALPEVAEKRTVINPIDLFVQQRLKEEALQPAPEADKETLLRRLSLDLTGLPPTPAEMDAFLADHSATAYERQVNRLLASPHFGERMATDWMDVARFADSHGYTVDRLRDMSPWRDWVIKAFNQNLPYSDFITWQLAGDLLPSPTRDQLVATGFNRNHQQNMEGGIVEEEFRVEYVADRTNTTSEAFMALTVGCAKCHDHKYDPISQKAYYQMFSFFNNVKEAGQISWDDAMPVPTLLLTTPQKDSILSFIRTLEGQKMAGMKQQQEAEAPAFKQWLGSSAYRKLPYIQKGLVASFPLTAHSLNNSVGGGRPANMLREGNTPDTPHFIRNTGGTALLFNGDTWLNAGQPVHFRRSDPFSIALWVNVPAGLKKGVLFHQGSMHLTYNFRGFHLAVEEGRLQLEMAHTAPYNAIIEYTKQDIPRDQWVHVAVTYDGSSVAGGYKIFLNGNEMPTLVDQDNLYKDILFNDPGSQPGIQFGAWERGRGLSGGKVHSINIYNRELSTLELWGLAGSEKLTTLVSMPPAELSEEQKKLLREYFMLAVSPAQQEFRQQLKEIRARFTDSVGTVPELMVMQEMKQPRKAYVLDRGLYDSHREEVQPDLPNSILPMKKDLPRNRLGYAKWLIDPDHPLTARVAVNRYWQLLFGRGLVKTAEDFGNQGEMPSHPELLDWLAIEFRNSGWNVKALMKKMVMSYTYRQSSIASKALLQKDPENILLARGPASRLSAEMLRDNALLAAGLLNETIGGKSVYPYQPEGLWRINGAEYRQDTGASLYRRALYTIWKRSVPNPTQSTFDAGIRTSCVVRRQNTNTPLQALVILNDPTYLEAAKCLGEQMCLQTEPREAVSTAFRKLTGRRPATEELRLLLELRQKQIDKFRKNPSKTKGWLASGWRRPSGDADPVLLAANTVVASTILNSDATITKR